MTKDSQKIDGKDILLAIRDNLLKPMAEEIETSVDSTEKRITAKLDDSIQLNKESFEALTQIITVLAKNDDIAKSIIAPIENSTSQVITESQEDSKNNNPKFSEAIPRLETGNSPSMEKLGKKCAFILALCIVNLLITSIFFIFWLTTQAA